MSYILRHELAADCTEFRANVQALHDFDDTCREITFETFAKNTHWNKWAESVGYGKHLALKNDYAVSFYSGKIMGSKAYVCMWSGIHVIFSIGLLQTRNSGVRL